MPTWERWKEARVTDDHVSGVERKLRACNLLERMSFCFDAVEHSMLRSAVAAQLHIDENSLGDLHVLDEKSGTKPKKNSRRTRGPNANEAALNDLREAHQGFVCSVVAPHVAECWSSCTEGDRHGPLTELIFQAVPSLRLAPPAVAAIGRRHRDRDYGHQPGQINFWLPLSKTFGSNTLYVEDFVEGISNGILEGDGDQGKSATTKATALEGDFGTAHRFYGNGSYHFTVPNSTDKTRVSIDFRVIPGPLFEADWEGSRHPETGRQSFFLGGYYDRVVLHQGVWAVASPA